MHNIVTRYAVFFLLNIYLFNSAKNLHLDNSFETQALVDILLYNF